jgi:hypothetical protein
LCNFLPSDFLIKISHFTVSIKQKVISVYQTDTGKIMQKEKRNKTGKKSERLKTPVRKICHEPDKNIIKLSLISEN